MPGEKGCKWRRWVGTLVFSPLVLFSLVSDLLCVQETLVSAGSWELSSLLLTASRWRPGTSFPLWLGTGCLPLSAGLQCPPRSLLDLFLHCLLKKPCEIAVSFLGGILMETARNTWGHVWERDNVRVWAGLIPEGWELETTRDRDLY